LKEDKAPAQDRQRIYENAHYAIEKLKQPNLAKLLPSAYKK
jgi:hypothetical protein